MKFDFFTFGGALFWEDVFFYQKWRIQRNCNTKIYRLLDSWDICRAKGSFEDCRKAFIHYIESYEITKQRGKMIVLLHGYTNGKNIFKPLWRKLILTNSTIAALNYPSLFRNSVASAHQLLFFLNHIEDISEVSFVTKGAGNLVLQQALNLPLELQTFRNNMRIANIVEINPVEKGNLLCDFLNRFKILRFLGGPMLYEMTEKGIKRLPRLSEQTNFLKIYSKSLAYVMFTNILKKCNFPIEKDKIPLKNSISFPPSTWRTLKNDQILHAVIKFINNGKI